MTVEQQIELNEELKSLIRLAPTIKQLFSRDVAVTISDRVKVVHQIFSSDFNVDYDVGRVLDPNEPMYKVMRNNKREVVNVPAEMYGIELRVILTPAYDDYGEVIGCIAISTSVNNQAKLMQVAEAFANSSEEISASTEELAKSSADFSSYIKNLSEAQTEMRNQVDNTTKILEMINSVAKNTRILGFNAGIEAARSGEYGRGFSVVAKEITKLADQSADSVNEIRQLIDKLKEKVDQVATIVNDSVEISNGQTATINEISENLQHLSQVAEDIEEMAKKI